LVFAAVAEEEEMLEAFERFVPFFFG